jgi:hypothetical protein
MKKKTRKRVLSEFEIGFMEGHQAGYWLCTREVEVFVKKLQNKYRKTKETV